MATAVVCGSCNLHNAGLTAPEGTVSYPQGIALSRDEEQAGAAGDGPDFVYIANTNYDLRYNGASVQGYSLKALDQALASNHCRELAPVVLSDASIPVRDNTTYAIQAGLDAGVGGDASAALPGLGGMDASIELPDWRLNANVDTPRGVLCDGRDPIGDGRTELHAGDLAAGIPNPDCCWGTAPELARVRSAHVPIDSYASAIAVSPDDKRLYVPVESFSRLLFFDFNTPGVPDCGTAPGERCRRGPTLKSADNAPDINVPGQIANLQVGKYSQLGLVKTAGQDETFLATTHELGGFGLYSDDGSAAGPILEDAITGLPVRPTSLTFDPRHQLLYSTANGQSFFSRIGARISEDPSVGGRKPAPRELLFASSAVVVTGVKQPSDLRDVVLDPFDDNRVWVLIRGTQESVAVLELDSNYGSANARLVDEIRLGSGPSKLARIHQDGRWFVLASLYDDKKILVIDAESHVLVSVIGNLSGPFQMVHDPVRRLVYVTDFRVSVVRVIDVAGLTVRGQPLPRIVATLGDPEFEGALP